MHNNNQNNKSSISYANIQKKNALREKLSEMKISPLEALNNPTKLQEICDYFNVKNKKSMRHRLKVMHLESYEEELKILKQDNLNLKQELNKSCEEVKQLKKELKQSNIKYEFILIQKKYPLLYKILIATKEELQEISASSEDRTSFQSLKTFVRKNFPALSKKIISKLDIIEESQRIKEKYPILYKTLIATEEELYEISSSIKISASTKILNKKLSTNIKNDLKNRTSFQALKMFVQKTFPKLSETILPKLDIIEELQRSNHVISLEEQYESRPSSSLEQTSLEIQEPTISSSIK